MKEVAKAHNIADAMQKKFAKVNADVLLEFLVLVRALLKVRTYAVH